MKKILQYFHKRQDNDFFNRFKTDFLIIQVAVLILVNVIVGILAIVNHNENFPVLFLSIISMLIFAASVFFLLKLKGIDFAGNVFSVGTLLIALIAINILPENIPILFKFFNGFFYVFIFMAYSLLFANRLILTINTVAILITTTRVYFYGMAHSPEDAVYFNDGFISHTATLILVFIIFFFTKKYTELAIKKANIESEKHKNQNLKLKTTQVKLKEKEQELLEHNLLLEEKVKERTVHLQTINNELVASQNENLKLSQAINQTDASVVITDLDGNIEYTNPAFTKSTGYTAKEAKGLNPKILKSGNTTREEYKELWDKITNGQTWRGEFLNFKKNKETYWEKAIITPLRDKENKITNYLAIKEDISEQKKYEKELKISEEKYRLIAENAMDCIWVYNLSLNKFTYISPSLKYINGYSPEERMQQNMADTLLPEQAKEAEKIMMLDYQNFIKNPNETSFKVSQYQEKHKNGSLVWVEISTRYQYNANKEIEVLGISRNIEDRKKIEKKLRIRMQQQQTLIDNVPASIFIKDADLKFIAVNKVYAKRLKTPIKEIIGKRYTDFFPDEQFVEDIDKEILKTSKPKLNFIKQAGDKWLQISKVPYFDSKNKVLGIVGIIQDITERQNEKQKIIELNSDLKHQKQEQDILNQKLFAQSLEVDQQRIEIEDKNILLNKQKEEITIAYKNITDSINYAKSIQDALLTRTELIDSYFSGEYFILFKPKEVVSGDFYYINKVDNSLLFAVADCTGHGVPGGFITMLGITYLHGIVRRFETNNPGDALNILRKRIKEIFKTFGTENNNGLDIAFCSIDLDTHILQYAGAYNPLWIIRNSEFIEIKAIRNPIGFYPIEKSFKNNEIQLQDNDKIYIFSDGYKDQFGGELSTTYSKKRFREFIISISDLPMQLQNELLETELQNWQGNNEQIDDITILGLEYKTDKFA